MKKKLIIIAVILALATVVSLILAVSSYSKYRNTVESLEYHYLATCKAAQYCLREYQDSGDETKYDSMVYEIWGLATNSLVEDGINEDLHDLYGDLNECHWLLINHKEECTDALYYLDEALSKYIENQHIAGFELWLQYFIIHVEDALR